MNAPDVAALLIEAQLARSERSAVLAFQSHEHNAAWSARQFLVWRRNPHVWVRVLRERAEPAAPVAFFAVFFPPQPGPPMAMLANIAVAPAWRRRGVGRLALQHVEREARRRSAARIELHVHESNLVAQRLYRAMGYRAVQILRRGFGSEDAYRMVRELN